MAFEEHKTIFIPEERSEVVPLKTNSDWLIFLKCFRNLITV